MLSLLGERAELLNVALVAALGRVAGLLGRIRFTMQGRIYITAVFILVKVEVKVFLILSINSRFEWVVTLCGSATTTSRTSFKWALAPVCINVAFTRRVVLIGLNRIWNLLLLNTSIFLCGALINLNGAALALIWRALFRSVRLLALLTFYTQRAMVTWSAIFGHEMLGLMLGNGLCRFSLVHAALSTVPEIWDSARCRFQNRLEWLLLILYLTVKRAVRSCIIRVCIIVLFLRLPIKYLAITQGQVFLVAVRVGAGLTPISAVARSWTISKWVAHLAVSFDGG